MKIATIKKINEKMPAWMKLPFSSIIRKQLIDNPVFIEQYQKLCQEASVSHDESVLEIKKCLCYAYKHTEYYRRLFDNIGFNPKEFSRLEELSKIPLLTRDILREEYGSIASDDINNFYEVSTGGTSGKPVHILMDKNAIYREWAFVYHYWKEYGYDYHTSKLATFRGVDFNGRWYKYNPLYSELRLNPFQMNDKTIFDYVRKIKSYGAEFLYGYPSIIYNFCRLCNKNQIKLDGMFKAVFLISENLYQYQEEIIQTVTGSPIAMFYGHSERAVFAKRERMSGYRFDQRYGFVEITVDGNIIATGGMNPKMPMIRYLVDDIAIQRLDGTYDIQGHHYGDVLYGNDGVQISMATLNFHDDTMNGVNAYQFIQNKVGVCEMLIECDEYIDLENIKTAVQRKMGESIVCTVRKVDNIQYTKRGKYQMLIQNVKFSGGGYKTILPSKIQKFRSKDFATSSMETECAA